jgi:hypothetical protein
MSTTPTLREQVLARLTAQLGKPLQSGNISQWSIGVGRAHGQVNIWVDSWQTPNEINVWLFDPRKRGAGEAHFAVRAVDRIDAMAQWVNERLSADPE